MDCLDVRPYLALHPDAGEAADVREGVAAHLRACPACAAEARRLNAAWEILRAWDVPAPQGDLVPRVRERLRDGAVLQIPGRRRPPRWIPYAAAAAVLFGVASVLVLPRGRVTTPAADALDVSPAEIDVVRNLDVLEHMDVAETMDLLAADVSADVEPGPWDLLPVEPSPEAGQEY